MHPRVREHAPAIAVAALALCAVAWRGLAQFPGDWNSEARPAVDALLGGHPLGFLQLAPAYGGSLILRAPFALVAKLWGGDEMAIYRAAAVPCLLASAALSAWLVARMRELGRAKSARALVLLLCVANPITVTALSSGHPEDVLGAVLCVAAVLAATRDRPIWSGVLLGLAIANKEWGILATGPVLLALPERRWRSLLTAGAVAGAVLAPLVLTGLSSGGFVTGVKSAAVNTGGFFGPWQAWWFLGFHAHGATGLYGNIALGYRVPPAWINSVPHPLIVAVMVPLTWLYAALRRHRRRRTQCDALLLLMLLMLVRCVLDPWDNAYYPLPFLFALLAWEALSRERLPVLALAGSLITWFLFRATGDLGLAISPDLQSLMFLGVAVPAVLVIAVALYAPDLSERLAVRMGGRRPVPSLA
jgi:hypothetical protein